MNRLCRAEEPGPYSPQDRGAAVSSTAPFQQVAGLNTAGGKTTKLHWFYLSRVKTQSLTDFKPRDSLPYRQTDTHTQGHSNTRSFLPAS